MTGSFTGGSGFAAFGRQPGEKTEGVIVKAGGNEYTTAMPRQASSAVFAVNVIEVNGSGSMTIQVEHKNSADTTWSTASTNAGITATGMQIEQVTDLKEQVRLKFALTGGVGNDVRMRVQPLQPSWGV